MLIVYQDVKNYEIVQIIILPIRIAPQTWFNQNLLLV